MKRIIGFLISFGFSMIAFGQSTKLYPNFIYNEWDAAFIQNNRIIEIDKISVIQETELDTFLSERYKFNSLGNKTEEVHYFRDSSKASIFIFNWQDGSLKNTYRLNARNSSDTIDRSLLIYRFPEVIVYDQWGKKRLYKNKTIYKYGNDSLLKQTIQYHSSLDSTKITGIDSIYYYNNKKQLNNYYDETNKLVLSQKTMALDEFNFIDYTLDENDSCILFNKQRYNDMHQLESELKDYMGEISVVEYSYRGEFLILKKVIKEDGTDVFFYHYKMSH